MDKAKTLANLLTLVTAIAATTNTTTAEAKTRWARADKAIDAKLIECTPRGGALKDPKAAREILEFKINRAYDMNYANSDNGSTKLTKAISVMQEYNCRNFPKNTLLAVQPDKP